MRYVDLMMDLLAELAAGDKPKFPKDGLCYNVTYPMINDGPYSIGWFVLHEAFIQMGLDGSYPLGKSEWRRSGDKWRGKRGARRRKLAYDVLVLLIASAGYRGKYQ